MENFTRALNLKNRTNGNSKTEKYNNVTWSINRHTLKLLINN